MRPTDNRRTRQRIQTPCPAENGPSKAGIEAEAYRVLTAASLAPAPEHARREPAIEVLILQEDQLPDGVTGAQAIAALRARQASVTVKMPTSLSFLATIAERMYRRTSDVGIAQFTNMSVAVGAPASGRPARHRSSHATGRRPW